MNYSPICVNHLKMLDYESIKEFLESKIQSLPLDRQENGPQLEIHTYLNPSDLENKIFLESISCFAKTVFQAIQLKYSDNQLNLKLYFKYLDAGSFRFSQYEVFFKNEKKIRIIQNLFFELLDVKINLKLEKCEIQDCKECK